MPDKEDINQSSRLASLSGWQKPCPKVSSSVILDRPGLMQAVTVE